MKQVRRPGLCQNVEVQLAGKLGGVDDHSAHSKQCVTPYGWCYVASVLSRSKVSIAAPSAQPRPRRPGMDWIGSREWVARRRGSGLKAEQVWIFGGAACVKAAFRALSSVCALAVESRASSEGKEGGEPPPTAWPRRMQASAEYFCKGEQGCGW